MPSRLLLTTAALAATLAVPTAAAADPACVSVGYSVLGSGSDHGVCVPTSFSTAGTSASVGDASLVELRASAAAPVPLVVQLPAH
jgi:hypothetical protein